MFRPPHPNGARPQASFGFDGSDLMPGKIGAGAFWTGMIDFVGGKSADQVASDIQKAWDGLK